MYNFLSVSSVFTYIGYIVAAILVLLLMVLIHELGHYIAGKILKFKIHEFSIGFGPKIFQKKKKNGELVSVRVFPLGGYCAFEGEAEDGSEDPGAYNKQAPWKRLIVLFSGAFFNFLSAIVFSFILLISNGYDLVEVKNLSANSINYEVLQTEDVIYGIEGVEIDFVKDNHFTGLMSKSVENKYPKYLGADITTETNTYEKDGKTFYIVQEELNYNIRRDGEEQVVNGYINVIFDSEGKYHGWSLLTSNVNNPEEFSITTYKYSFGESLLQCVPFTVKWAWKVLVIFGQLITGQLSLASLGGPVTTINMIASYTQQSFSYLLVLLPVIAVNLAVFNLLPIPALDGFQMIFTGIEWVRKKPVNPKVVNIINNIGLILLFGFVIVVDILQFVL